MPSLIEMRRIEILADEPLVRRVRDTLLSAGVERYTVLPVLAGGGSDGRWSDDQVTGGAGSKVLIVATVNPVTLNQLLEAAAPVVREYELALIVTRIDVMRTDAG